MSGTEWTSILGAVGGLIGALGGGGGAIIAIYAKRDSGRSAGAAEKSAIEAAKVSQIQVDRQHQDMAPKAPAEIKTELRDDTLWGRITVSHDYRVSAVGIYSTQGEHELEISRLLRANQSYDFAIESWPPGRTEPTTGQIRFRFWPPAASDDVTLWSCRCDRPTGDDPSGEGHWQWVVPVAAPTAGPFVAWGD